MGAAIYWTPTLIILAWIFRPYGATREARDEGSTARSGQGRLPRDCGGDRGAAGHGGRSARRITPRRASAERRRPIQGRRPGVPAARAVIEVWRTEVIAHPFSVLSQPSGFPCQGLFHGRYLPYPAVPSHSSEQAALTSLLLCCRSRLVPHERDGHIFDEEPLVRLHVPGPVVRLKVMGPIVTVTVQSEWRPTDTCDQTSL